jgi:hypothetical protein
VFFRLAYYDKHKSIYLGYDIANHQFHIIFEEVGYSVQSTISSSLRGQAPYAFRQLHKFQSWKMTTVFANSLCAYESYSLHFYSCVKEAGNVITWLHSGIKGRFWVWKKKRLK